MKLLEEEEREKEKEQHVSAEEETILDGQTEENGSENDKEYDVFYKVDEIKVTLEK